MPFLPNATEITRGRLPVDNMEMRWIEGADHVTLDGQPFAKDHVFLLGRIARAANLRVIAGKAIDMTETQVEAASRFSPRYVVNQAYAAQLPPTTWSKPILAMRTDRREIALLDGRQRAWKAFSTGLPTIKADVVTLEEARTVGLHPLTGELNLIRSAFVKTLRWDQICMLLSEMSDENVLAPTIDKLLTGAKKQQWAAVRDALAAMEGCRDLAETLNDDNCDWNIIRERLRRVLNAKAAEDVIRRLRASAEASKWPDLLRALGRLKEIEQIEYPLALGYTVLNSTRLNPVVFKTESDCPGPEHSFVVQLVHAEPLKRAALSADGERVSNFFYLFCIELCLTERYIATKIPGRSRRFEGIRSRFQHCNQRWSFEEAGDKYLKAMWGDLGLERKAIISFSDMLQRFSNILASLAKGGTLVRFQEMLNKDLLNILRQSGEDALVTRHGDLVKTVRTFCRAHIRAREWTSAKIAVTHYEQRSGQRAPAAAIHQAARKGLDEGDSLVDFSEIMSISAMSGVIATKFFPHMAKINTLCEAWAFLFWYQFDTDQALAYCTPTLVEAYMHRRAIDDNKQADNVSKIWKYIFGQYDKAGLNYSKMYDYHKQLEIKKVIDEPDRGMTSYLY